MLAIAGCQQAAEPIGLDETPGTNGGIQALPDDLLADESLVDYQEASDEECDIILCLSGTKEIYCTDEFAECAAEYDECRMISCDPELATEAPVKESCSETKNMCVLEIEGTGTAGTVTSSEKKLCIGDYEYCASKYGNCECGVPTNERCCCFTEMGAYMEESLSDCEHCVSEQKCEATQEEEVVCDEKKHTCYYMTEETYLEDQYLAPVMMAFTCQGTYQDCKAHYGDCECGLTQGACTEGLHTCFKGKEFVECSGSFAFCLRKNTDCTCGLLYGCDKQSNKCYQQGEEYVCGGTYEECAQRYDKCLCGFPGQGCSGTEHMCYNSERTTTTYETEEGEICNDYYDNCALEYDWCECGTDDVVDYSCPLMQHSCGGMICNDDFKSCEKEFGNCDCGITADVRPLASGVGV